MLLIPVSYTLLPVQASTSLPDGFEAVPNTVYPSSQTSQPRPILDYTSPQAGTPLVCEDDYSSSDFLYTNHSGLVTSHASTPVLMNSGAGPPSIDVSVSSNIETPHTTLNIQPDTSIHDGSSASRADASSSGRAAAPDLQHSLSGGDLTDQSPTQAAIHSTGGLTVDSNVQDVMVADTKDEREALTSEVRELRMTNTLMLCELGEAQAKEHAMEVSHGYVW